MCVCAGRQMGNRGVCVCVCMHACACSLSSPGRLYKYGMLNEHHIVLQDLMQSNMEWRPTLEDSSRHWGVRVGGEGRGGKRGECGVCQAPLSVVVSDQQPGVLLFHCGRSSTYTRHSDTCIYLLHCGRS